MHIRQMTERDSVPELTRMLHAAYARLAAMGYNFTAIDQSEDATRRQIASSTCLIAVDGDDIIGTIQVLPPGRTGGCPHYERSDVAVFGKFAVRPDRQGAGLGRALIAQAEDVARLAGARHLALDTADSNARLLAWYTAEGFCPVETLQWPGKTYRSVVLSRPIGQPVA